MGVRVNQYGKEIDKTKKSESLQASHKRAVKRSSVKAAGKSKYSREDLIKRTKRRLKELFYGETAYLPGHKKPKTAKRAKKTERTKQVEGGLKNAGLSDSDIAKFRRKG